MTLIHTDGFETYNTTSDIALVWMEPPFSLESGGRTGGIRIVSAGTFRKALGADEHATVIAGAAIRTNGQDVSFNGIRFYSDSGATTHINVRRVAGGYIAIDRGGTNVALSAAGLWAAVGWTYVEVKVVLSDTVGSVEVRLNGAVAPSLTFSGDTKNGGTKTVIDSVGFDGYVNQANGGIDDVYICNGAGGSNNNFLGEIRCWPLVPNGNGNYSQLVGSDGNSVNNYQQVDEGISVASDYNGSPNVGDKDTYTYTDLTPSTGTVLSVKLVTAALKSDAGTKQFRPLLRISGTDYPSTDRNLGTSEQRFEQLYTTSPATAAAWTISEINGAEAGFEVRT